MRRTLLITALLLFCSSAAWADPIDRWRLSVLAAEISLSQEQAWQDEPHAGIGVGLAYAPTPDWDVELTLSSQTHRSPYVKFFHTPGPGEGQPGFTYPAIEYRDHRVHPLDLSVTRHFLADEVIAPYVRAGVRYVAAPEDPGPRPPAIPLPGGPMLVPVSEGFGLRDRASAQAGAGMRIRLTQRAALRTEVTRLLRSDESTFDPLTRYALGVSWMF